MAIELSRFAALSRTRRGATGAVVLAAALVAALFGPAAAAEERCVRSLLARPITEPNGLQSLPSGDFLVVSPQAGTITRFAPDGTERWTRQGEPEPPADFTSPAAITRVPGSEHLLIHERFTDFYVADLEGTIVAKHQFGRETPLRPVFEFGPPTFLLPGERIAGVAMFRPRGSDEVVAGLVVVPLRDGAWRGPLTTLDLRDRSFVAYTLDARMLTATATGLVFLVAGDTYELRSLVGEEVRSVPLHLAGLAPFPKDLRPGPVTMGAVHSALHGRRLPLGIYWDRDELFVLVASPLAASSGRRWELVAVDPVSGRAKRSLLLPTEADEVGISPGATHWIVLEKRILGVEGIHRATSVLQIPASWFHDPASPLRTDAARAVRCDP